MMNRKAIASAITIGAVALVAAGCDSGGEVGHDAGVAKGRSDTARRVYNMPHGIHNIAVFCSYGNLVYEASGEGSAGFVVVLPKAAQCAGVEDGGVPHA